MKDYDFFEQKYLGKNELGLVIMGIRINWLIRALAFKSRSQVSNGKYGLS